VVVILFSKWVEKWALSPFFSCAFLSSFYHRQINTSLVNPFIGTGRYGHIYQGASRLFGMMQCSPVGNEATDSVIRSGFKSNDTVNKSKDNQREQVPFQACRTGWVPSCFCQRGNGAAGTVNKT
jgi:hypothetical protein